MNELDTKPVPDERSSGWSSRDNVQALVLVAGTGLGLYVFFLLGLPFLGPLAWALALAVLFTPMHRALERKIKRPNLAATITVVLIGLILVLVVAFVVERLVTEAAKGAAAIKLKVESGEWTNVIESYPFLAPLGRWIEANTDLSGTVNQVASWLTTKAASLVQGSVVQFISVLLMFYFLFFFLRDRRKALQSLRWLSPLPEATTDKIGRRVVDTIDAIFYGTLAVAAVQGTLGGLMFWWLGLAVPLLWGIMMGLLAVVPVLGASIIWLPAAIFLALEGSWWKAIVLAVWGSVVVGGIDNLLYPMLVGNRLKMHTALAFISVVGGLIVYGPAGIIFGPVVVTITISLLEFWHVRNAEAKD
ncbi:MAG: AI-2E family transporter [Opitutaceae bacterium]